MCRNASQFQGVLTQEPLVLVSCAFPSLSSLPSFRLSPSFCNNTFERARQSTHSERIVLSSHHRVIFTLVRSRKKLHTCKLTLAGLRSPDIKYGAWGSHAWFSLPLYRPDTSVRASNVQVRCVYCIHSHRSTTHWASLGQEKPGRIHPFPGLPLVWIWRFLSQKVIAKIRLKSQVGLTISRENLDL